MVYCEICQTDVKNFNSHCKTYTHNSGALNLMPFFKWCKTCDKEIVGKDLYRKSFCNQSCAASYNNRKYKKKELKKIFCVTCKKEIERFSYKDEKRRKYCSDKCNPQKINWDNVKYGNVLKLRNYQKHSRIRDLARTVFFKSELPKACVVCGYDRHIEICHFKQIFEHSDDTPISEINKLENLIPLCRNHHWELDKFKDKKVISDIKRYKEKLH